MDRSGAKDALDSFFEPFFSTRTRKGGKGLGLSLAHGILAEHRGEIRVNSVPDEGTRVVLSLPLEEPSTPSD